MVYGSNSEFCVDCVHHIRGDFAQLDTCKVDGKRCMDKRGARQTKNVGYHCPDYKAKKRLDSITDFVIQKAGESWE